MLSVLINYPKSFARGSQKQQAWAHAIMHQLSKKLVGMLRIAELRHTTGLVDYRWVECIHLGIMAYKDHIENFQHKDAGGIIGIRGYILSIDNSVMKNAIKLYLEVD